MTDGQSAFGIDHGGISKAVRLPGFGGGSHRAAGAAKIGSPGMQAGAQRAKSGFSTAAGQFKAGLKNPGLGGGTFKPYKPFAAGQTAGKAGGFINQNRKPLGIGAAGGAAGTAGIMGNRNRNRNR